MYPSGRTGELGLVIDGVFGTEPEHFEASLGRLTPEALDTALTQVGQKLDLALSSPAKVTSQPWTAKRGSQQHPDIGALFEKLLPVAPASLVKLDGDSFKPAADLKVDHLKFLRDFVKATGVRHSVVLPAGGRIDFMPRGADLYTRPPNESVAASLSTMIDVTNAQQTLGLRKASIKMQVDGDTALHTEFHVDGARAGIAVQHGDKTIPIVDISNGVFSVLEANQETIARLTEVLGAKVAQFKMPTTEALPHSEQKAVLGALRMFHEGLDLPTADLIAFETGTAKYMAEPEARLLLQHVSAQLERLERINLDALPSGESLLKLDRLVQMEVERTQASIAKARGELRAGKTALENRLRKLADTLPTNGVI